MAEGASADPKHSSVTEPIEPTRSFVPISLDCCHIGLPWQALSWPSHSLMHGTLTKLMKVSKPKLSIRYEQSFFSI
jgi:hypothetical protein